MENIYLLCYFYSSFFIKIFHYLINIVNIINIINIIMDITINKIIEDSNTLVIQYGGV